MSKIVSDRSAATYLNQNVRFIMWMYDDTAMRELLLAPFCIERLSAAAGRDATATTARSRNTRKEFRDEGKTILNSIDRTNPLTFPIFLSRITFPIFTRYMNSRKKTMQVVVDQEENDGAPEEVQAYLSTSMYDGMRSALMHLFRITEQKMDSNLQKLLSKYVKGLKRVVAKDKKKTGQKLTEGKRHMSRAVYELSLIHI